MTDAEKRNTEASEERGDYMSGENTKPGDIVELEDMGVILRIPKEAVRLEMTVLILDEDGNLQEVSAEFSASDIREARQAFLDNVEFGDDYDAIWQLTEKGRRQLEEMNGTEEAWEDAKRI